MDLSASLEFDHEDRRRIYEYVERNGPTSKRELRRSLGLDEGALVTHLALLRRNDYVTVTDGTVAPAYDAPGAEEHEVGDISFVIRQAEEDDRSSLIDVIHDVADEGTYMAAESIADILAHEEVLLRHNEVESRLFFVATIDDDIVGWVHLRLPEYGKLSHTAELTVGVREGFRGLGIGSQLLRRGERWADDRGLEKLYNSAPGTNERAIEFLEEHGWTVEAVRADHYSIDDAYVDEVMMATRLE